MITKYNLFENIDIDENINHSDIVIKSFQIILQLKTYHWQNENFGDHKKFDEFDEIFNTLNDKIIEVVQGKYGRVNIPIDTYIPVKNLIELEPYMFFDNCISFYKQQKEIYLNDSDIISLLDEMIGNIEQLKYLLTFK